MQGHKGARVTASECASNCIRVRDQVLESASKYIRASVSECASMRILVHKHCKEVEGGAVLMNKRAESDSVLLALIQSYF